MWGQLRIIQGATKNNIGARHLKIRGGWEKFKYEGAYKISWGLEKIEGQGFQGACYRGSITFPYPHVNHIPIQVITRLITHNLQMTPSNGP